jgi:soluble cytochrome b562
MTSPASPVSVQTDLQKAESFRMYIEQEVLKIITSVVEKGADKDHVQAMAQTVLDNVKPGMTVDELYRATAKLDDSFPEFAPVVFSIMEAYEDKFEKRAVDEVSSLVRSGKYDDAQAMVKKVLEYKMM